jgi:hypothetical protein
MTRKAIRSAPPSRRRLLTGAAGLALAAGLPRSGRAAVTFKDPLMKLFVVAELMRRKRIALGAPNAFFLRLLGRPHDTKVDGYRAHPRALDYFAQLALGADDLAAVEQLDLDGGNPVFRYVDPNWQGYSSVSTRSDASMTSRCCQIWPSSRTRPSLRKTPGSALRRSAGCPG